ncbi:MAG TPA: hypothetical protein VLS25_10480 [Dehalococcoidia bacterium]|nr:hypothetical protein [Dehalococcoidia bacterium]
MRLALVVAAAGLVTVLGGCGGGDDNSAPSDSSDQRIKQIEGLAGLATNAYAATNGEGLLDYLASDMAKACTKEDIMRALAGQTVPTGVQALKDVKFDGEDKASATVVLKTREGDRDAVWSFVREGDSWRIISMPSLTKEDCGNS